MTAANVAPVGARLTTPGASWRASARRPPAPATDPATDYFRMLPRLAPSRPSRTWSRPAFRFVCESRSTLCESGLGSFCAADGGWGYGSSVVVVVMPSSTRRRPQRYCWVEM